MTCYGRPVFTDLDGTLLDGETYRWAAARPALDLLRRKRVPLVIVTSKTRDEVRSLLRALGRREPFVVENGGAIIVPAGYFPFALEGAKRVRGGWQEIPLGIGRALSVKALARASRRSGVRVRGFSQMSVHDVARSTGLGLRQARAALRRQYDEPFVIFDRSAAAWPRLGREIRGAGLSAVRGTRLFHISGASDKGAAVRRLMRWFRRAARVACGGGLRRGDARGSCVSVGLGDSPNDVPLLRAVDLPIVVAGARGRYDAETLHAVPQARRAGGIGPVGWNRAILGLWGVPR